MIFYKMDKAGLLRGMPSDVDISFAWKLVSVVDDAKLKVFETKNPGRLTARFKHVPESFARMIAKIGYGRVLTVLDPEDIRLICLPYILGQLRNVSYVVGGRLNIRDPDAGMGYVLRTGAFGTLERLMIVAEVRLIANNHTPTYHVIVGDALGRSNVVAVLAKLNASPTDLLPLHVGNLGEQPSDEHWLPSVWPLPFWSNTSVGRGSARSHGRRLEKGVA